MTPQDSQISAEKEKKAVALSSVLGAFVLTSLKIVVGVSTGSLGILSEAAHSALDLVAAVVTFFAVRTSAKPADPDHTYGHGKVESLSALFETLLLVLTCVWIVGEAYERLFVKWVPVEATLWSFIVIVISIVIDVSRSRALKRVAKKYKSQALEADALHFSTDVWSSCVVLLGLVGVWVADKFHIYWLAKMDAVAALGVALIVIWISFEMGKKTIHELLDAVHPELQGRIRALAEAVPGVLGVGRVRVRKSGAETFTDLKIWVARDLPLETSHQIADSVELIIRNNLDSTDVVVHVEPSGSAQTSILTSIQRLSQQHGIHTHDISVADGKGPTSVDLHAEVKGSLSLGDAHQKVSQFEKHLLGLCPQITMITTHIEPELHTDKGDSPQHLEQSLKEHLQELLITSKAQLPLAYEIHLLKIEQQKAGLTLHLHIGCVATAPIVQVHQLTTYLEQQIHVQCPALSRIVIHPEPQQ